MILQLFAINDDKLINFTFNHADQVDEYGKSTGDFQIVQTNFDSRATELQTKHNSLIDTIQALTGSLQVGHTSASIASETVAEALEENRTEIDTKVDATNVLTLDNTTPYSPLTDYNPATVKLVNDTALAGIGDNSLTELKMAAEMKKQAGGVAKYNDLDILRIAELDTGVAGAYIVTTAGAFSRVDGNTLPFIPANNNTGASTINEDGNGIANIIKYVDGAWIDIEDGDLKKFQQVQLVWNASESAFQLAPKGGADTFDSWDNTFNTYKNAATTTMTEVINVTGDGWLDVAFNNSTAAYAIAIEIDGVFVAGSLTTGVDVFGQLQINQRFKTSLKVYVENSNIGVLYRLGDDYKTATAVYVGFASVSTSLVTSVLGKGVVVSIDGVSNAILDIDGVTAIDKSGSTSDYSTVTVMQFFEDGFDFYCSAADAYLNYVLL